MTIARRDVEFRELPVVHPDLGQCLDASKIATGAYSPLEGFMDRAALDSVLRCGRLPDGLAWPIPILLTPPAAEDAHTIAALRAGDEVALQDPEGQFFALLHLEETFELPRSSIAEAVYGTVDPAHPDVAALGRTGPTALAGKIDLLRLPATPLPDREVTPAAMRALFRSRGWNSVAAYQTRNPPHSGHEQLQRLTLEREDVDALLVHPVVGPLKEGDYLPEAVVGAYELYLNQYLPPDRVALATLSVPMRYAGPKAALFFALVRQNFGCRWYIVGRDQAGVGGFYPPYACHAVFDDFPLEIQPIRYREMAFCAPCGGMASDRSCRHTKESRIATSQTRIRTALREGAPLPESLLRPEVAAYLQSRPVLRGAESPTPVGRAPVGRRSSGTRGPHPLTIPTGRHR